MKTLITLILLSSSVLAITPYTPSQDVTAHIKKMEACHHWGGEEAYDENRGKEILAAVTKLGCDSIDKEMKSLKSKYAANKGALAYLAKAEKDFQ